MSDRNNLTKKYRFECLGHYGEMYDEAGEEVHFPNGTLFYLASDIDKDTAEPRCPCGTAYLRVEGGYVPVCACAAKASLQTEPEAPQDEFALFRRICTCPSINTIDPKCPLAFPHPWQRQNREVKP